MYSVLLVDDHTMIRDAIKEYFSDSTNFVLKAEAENGKEALKTMRDNSFDLILADINMPEMDGLEMTSHIMAKYPNQKILVLTMFDDPFKIKKMVELGVSGYILKNSSKSELLKAANSIVLGETYYSQEVYKSLMKLYEPQKNNRLTFEKPLSSREIEILKLIVKEYNNQEIADKLFISIRTVETHKRNLLEKTGCKNVAGLVMYAVEKGLI